jgi:signal transduction histidine kinase
MNEVQRERLDRSREEWIAGVSHDMKTPLSSVKGYANLLSSCEYDFVREEITSYARIIEEKATYMEDLIEDLNLTFALNNQSLPIQLKQENLVELVRRSVIDVINSKAGNQYTIDFLNQETDKILCRLDEKWFKRAIDNLLWNAMMHNSPGTTITIQITKNMEETKELPITIQISDNGKGMEEDILSRIFDRYYRGTNTNVNQVKGSGLGTAIAKQLIEAHKGSITAKSIPEIGTTFEIHLPVKN